MLLDPDDDAIQVNTDVKQPVVDADPNDDRDTPADSVGLFIVNQLFGGSATDE